MTRPADLAQARREADLLCKLQELEEYPESFWPRYHELEAKIHDETMISDSPEHRELIALSDEREGRQAGRLGILCELAKVRGTTLDEELEKYRRRVAAHV